MVQPTLLANHPFTSGLSAPVRKKLAAAAQMVRFGEDEIVFRAGEKTCNLYLVLSGGVCVEVAGSGYRLCIQAVGPGGAFGWGSLLPGHRTTFQVRSRDSATSAIRLDSEQLLAVCRRDPKLGSTLYLRAIELIAERLAATESRLVEFCGSTSADARRRLDQGSTPEPSP